MRDEKFEQHSDLKLPSLYAIVNVDTVANPLDYVKALFEAGCRLCQLRAKHIAPSEYGGLIRACVAMRPAHGNALLIINDSVELAKECGADGVHLGQTDSSPIRARELLGPKAVIGLSTHNRSQILSAPTEVLSYLAIGPLWNSKTKSGHADPVGLQTLKELATTTSLPLVAIGGITRERAGEVFAAGAASVAIISDLESHRHQLAAYISEITQAANRSERL